MASSQITFEIVAPSKRVLLLVGLLCLVRVPWLPGFILDRTCKLREVHRYG